MPITIKVKGGTRSQHSPRLCDTCKMAAVRRGPADSDVDLECNAFHSEVRFRVVECPKYHPHNHPWLHEMEETAWILQTDRAGRTIGFKHPRDEGSVARPAGFGRD